MVDRARILAAVDAYCRAQCDKDKDGWAALFSDDVFHEDPVGISQTHGKDAVTGAFWNNIVRNNVRIWLTHDVIVCGNEAIAILACEIGPDDNRRKLAPVVDHLIFNEDGKITSARGYYNFA